MDGFRNNLLTITYFNAHVPCYRMAEEKRENFSGKIGFVLAAAGSAVGLGNLWRFPYLADQYGGGIFLLVYIVLVVTFGFAMMLTETTLGRRTGKSCIDAFRDLSKKHAFIGYLAALVPIIIVPYYCVIGGWVVKYFAEFSIGAGSTAADGGAFFNDFISCSLPGVFDSPVTWFLIFAGLTVLVVALGVEKGSERISKILMPVLLVLMVVISAYALTMPGAGEGLEYYLLPDFSKFSMSTVLGALGQLFYSMSLAMGIMITYGSYMKKSVNIEKSVRQISIVDTGVALLAGLMIVPSVAALGMDVGSGPGLMFVTLPQVFEAMPGGELIGALFFFLVIIAAMTSAISLAETVVSMIMDRLKWKRLISSVAVIALILGLGILSCLGYGPLDWFTIIGQSFLDFSDFLTNSILMPIVAILTCLFVGYVVKPKYIADEIKISGEFKFEKAYTYLVKYVCPILLTFILITGLLSFFGIYKI